MTGDVFSSSRCDCGAQLDTFFKYRKKVALIYLRQEGRGIGLVEKLVTIFKTKGLTLMKLM